MVFTFFLRFSVWLAYIYIFMYTYIYIHIYIYDLPLCLFLTLSVALYLYVYIDMYMVFTFFLRFSVWLAYMYLCIHIYIYTYTSMISLSVSFSLSLSISGCGQSFDNTGFAITHIEPTKSNLTRLKLQEKTTRRLVPTSLRKHMFLSVSRYLYTTLGRHIWGLNEYIGNYIGYIWWRPISLYIYMYFFLFSFLGSRNGWNWIGQKRAQTRGTQRCSF